ncbi:MAG TPA: protein kinase [Vicinamibacterales bacterium]
MPLSAGVRLGPYEIVGALGAGGMGEVYRARDTRLRRDVALKILPVEVAADPSRRARFEQEAHAAAALNHPNILSVYDVGGTDETSYIATELVSGETLAAVVERGAVPVRALLDMAVQIADGLASAHAAHIVHRDLKPANVMITGEGRIKILDFGLAKQHVPAARGDETIAASHTVPGMIVGTVSYMSPEQARGRAVDYRSDQFSFGLLLYEMAAGKKAFDEPESVQTLAAIISDEPPPLDARLPAPLRWAIDRCLAKSPEGRYDSSRDLFHELRSLRDHLSEISTQVEHQAAAPPARRRTGAWRVPAAFLLGIVVPIAFALARMGPPPSDPSEYRFTPFSFEAGGQRLPVFAADGKAVAYAARQTASAPYQVYVRYLDQPTPMQLTKVRTPAYPLRWSPDSKRVLFMTAGDTPGIWSIATIGGEPQLVVSLPPSSVESGPEAVTVSADNSMAAFLARSDNGTWGVSTVALPGRTPTKYSVDPYASKAVYNIPSLQFSPDGRQILLLLNRGQNGEEGWLLKYPEEGSSGVRRIEPALKTFAETSMSAWMPDNRHVVMSLQPTPYGAKQLWLVDTQSSERHALTSGTKDAFDPSLAPSGDTLVFAETNGNFDVVSVDLATGVATTLVATERNEAMPAWAGTEPAMVYVGNRNGPEEIWLRRGGVPDRPIVTARDFPAGTTLWFMAPALSPRGDRVIYTRIARSGEGRLWISAVAGGSPIRATSDTQSGAELAGSWSPDGSWFAYCAEAGDKLNLMKVRTNGEDAPVMIKAGLPTDTPPADWSPAGDWIVAGSLLIAPDGRTERSIGLHGSPHYVFSKDGKRLYGLRPEDGKQTLLSIDVASGAERIIASGITFEPRSYLSPSIRFSLAPDGKSIIYGTGRMTYDLWMLEGFKSPGSLAARLGLRR